MSAIAPTTPKLTIQGVFASTMLMTHGTMVIASAAILDAQLESVLLKSFLPMSKREQERLVNATGPLSTFAGKILIARALGLVTHATFLELKTVRRIRNVFAHTDEILNLESERVAKHLRAQKIPADCTLTDPLRRFLACTSAIEKAINESALSARAESIGTPTKRKPPKRRGS